MMEDSTRVLAVEARLEDLQRTVMAHDLLLRGVLAYLALAEPAAFSKLSQALEGLTTFREGGAGGDLPPAVAQEIELILGEIRRSVAART